VNLVRSAVVRIETPVGMGSGTIINSQGIILTNYHVVQGYDTVTVTIEDQHRTDGTVVGYDDGLDLAVVKIEPGSWNHVPISLIRPSVGDEIFTIGYARGFDLLGESTVTRGSVSAFRPESRHTMIQTDAAINPGNSGGAAFTMDGRFFAVPTSKLRDSENLGFLVGLFSVASDITRLMDVRTEYRLSVNGFMTGQNKRMDVSAGTVTLSQTPRSDGTYLLNTSVTLSASAPPGYRIIWSGVDSEKGQFATVKMNADRFVTVDMRLLPTPQATPTRPPIPPTPTRTPIPSGYIAPINGSVTELKFFETPLDVVEYDNRVYPNYFYKNTARFILWELHVDHPAPGRQINYDIDAVYYRSDGSEMRRRRSSVSIPSDWNGHSYASGNGWSDAGKWPIDTYKVELSVQGQLVARGFFTVAP
jgi:hypothetical protein